MASSGSSGSDVSVHIEGLDELRARLVRLDKKLGPRIKATNFEAAMMIAKTANTHVPVGGGPKSPNDKHPGRLARTIRALATQQAAFVSAGSKAVPYAGAVHFGWHRRNIAPNPFLYDSVDDRRVEVVALYEVRVAALVEEAGGI